MPDRLAEIRARLDAVEVPAVEVGTQAWIDRCEAPCNADFFRAAPADIAYLLDEIEKANRAIDNLMRERERTHRRELARADGARWMTHRGSIGGTRDPGPPPPPAVPPKGMGVVNPFTGKPVDDA
jgi:hypothetical protein